MKSTTASANGKARTRSVSRWMPSRGERLERLVHRRRGRAEIDHAVARRLGGLAADRRRDEALRGLELAQQPLHVVDVGGAFLGVARVAVLATCRA